uniref:Putative secreted protein n=1 Tax=Anopheles marajoara TaxID=58244 RepID=A0A2M4C7J0_9DIPT
MAARSTLFTFSITAATRLPTGVSLYDDDAMVLLLLSPLSLTTTRNLGRPRRRAEDGKRSIYDLLEQQSYHSRWKTALSSFFQIDLPRFLPLSEKLTALPRPCGGCDSQFTPVFAVRS